MNVPPEVWHECTRCGMDVKFSYTQDDGTVIYEDSYHELRCDDMYTPWHDIGWGYPPLHTLDEQEKES